MSLFVQLNANTKCLDEARVFIRLNEVSSKYFHIRQYKALTHVTAVTWTSVGETETVDGFMDWKADSLKYLQVCVDTTDRGSPDIGALFIHLSHTIYTHSLYLRFCHLHWTWLRNKSLTRQCNKPSKSGPWRCNYYSSQAELFLRVFTWHLNIMVLFKKKKKKKKGHCAFLGGLW